MLSAALSSDEMNQLLELLDIGKTAERQRELRSAGAFEALEAAWDQVRDLPGPSPLIVWPLGPDDSAKPEVVAKVGAFVDLPISRTRSAAGSHSGWVVSGLLALGPDGDLVLSELALEPDPLLRSLVVDADQIRAQPVTEFLLRQIRPAQLLAKARAYLMHLPAWHEIADRHGLAAPSADEIERLRKIAKVAVRASAPKRGRRYDDDHYRWVALTYIELIHGGMRRGILAELARRASKRLRRPVARETARDWVHRARELGFLAPAEPGKPSPVRGPRLRDSHTDVAKELQESRREEP